MSNHSVFIACRDSVEGVLIRQKIEKPSAPVFHKSAQLLDNLNSLPDSFLVMTPLLLDETATGILTKRAIIQPGYNVLYAHRCKRALNILRLYGCGCCAIVGPDESDMLQDLLSPSEEMLSEIVMPPFFIDDDESSLKVPPVKDAVPVHVTFLGAQALVSCANALLNIRASSSMTMAAVGPKSQWTMEHMLANMREYTLWNLETKAVATGGAVTMCQDFESLSAIQPASQHFILCHGLLSASEREYLSRHESSAQVFSAFNDGYMDKSGGRLIAPEVLWDVIISALYG